MASLDDLLSQIPIDQLASRLGVDEQTAAQAATAAIPVLIGGMEANAKDPAGAASLDSALAEHSDALLQGGVDLDQVDTDDGAKIVANVFGSNRDQVINTLGAKGGGRLDAGMLAKVLPILAPLVMSYLAKSRGGSGGGGGGGLSDVLGGILGGAGGSGGSGGLGDILGGLVGGGEGGGLSDVLGGLLGGGKR